MKFALELLSMCDRVSSDLLDMAFVLAHVSELSSWCVPLVERMPDSNQKLYEIARSAGGYALVDCVEHLIPENAEMRSWMLRYGADDFLGWWYTAAAVTEKCDVLRMLQDPDLSDEDYDSIAMMIGDYFSEGYARNLRKLKNWAETVMTFLDTVLVRRRQSGIEALINLRNDSEAPEFEGNSDMRTIHERCCEIADSRETKRTVMELVQHGMACSCAHCFGIDCSEIVTSMFLDNPADDNSWHNLHDVTDKDCMKRILAWVEQHADILKLDEVMEPDSREAVKRYNCCMCIFELCKKSHAGQEFIERAKQSVDPAIRHAASSVFEETEVRKADFEKMFAKLTAAIDEVRSD